MSTKIIHCKNKCENEGQDKLHGAGMRVANSVAGKPTDSHIEVRCTVCLTQQNVKK